MMQFCGSVPLVAPTQITLCVMLGILSVLSTRVCFLRDPFAAHRRQMRSVFGSFGFDPFPLNPQIQTARAPMQVQVNTHIPIVRVLAS